MGILVDTSVCVDHLRNSNPDLIRLLEDDQVFCQPWVRGELALGSLRDRQGFLEVLGLLPMADEIDPPKTLELIEANALYNRGIGWVDAQLLTACRAYPCRLWTLDKKLAAMAQELKVGWQPDQAS